MLKKLAKIVLGRPKTFFFLTLAVTAFFLMFFPRLRIESDVKTMIPQNSGVVRTITDINDKFGGADYIVTLIECDDIFNSRTLKKIDGISADYRKLADVSDVLSITKMDEIKGVAMGLEVGPIVDRVPETKKEIEAFRKYLLGDKRYKGIFVSPDSRYTIIVTRLVSAANESASAKAVEDTVEKYRGPEKIYLIGPPFITRTIQGYLVKDLSILLPIVAGVIIIVLFLSFRSLAGVLVPLITVVLSTIWTMGLIGMLNEPLTMITTILPVILFSVGTAYALHIIARYEEEISNGFEKKESLEKAVSSTGVPVFLAAITTVFGFASNLFTSLKPIKVFGLASAFGVVISFLLALIFVPVLLLWLPKPKIKARSEKKNGAGVFTGFLKIIASGVARQKAAIIISILVIVVLCAAAIPRITTESNFIQYFKEGSSTKAGHNIMDREFGGSFSFDILVKGDILDPAVLKQMEKFEDQIKDIENVNHPNSIVDVLKEANQALNEGDKSYYAIPPSRQASAQFMLLLTMSGSSFMNSLITPDYREAHITARVSSVRTKFLTAAIAEVSKAAKKCFGPEVECVVSGSPLIIQEIQKQIISNQFSSLIMAFIGVVFIITLVYRTATSGIFAAMPIFVTVVIILGIMGWLKIPLDMANSMTGSIAIGIGIDYSCHFFARYKEERKKGATRSKGVEAAIMSVGGPIFFNAIAVGLGFTVLIFSSFSMLGMFGKLIGMAMFLSSVGALVILPMLILLKGKIRGEV